MQTAEASRADATPIASIVIRPIEPADVPDLLDLMRALARWHGKPEAVTVTDVELLRDGFGERPLFHAWIARDASGRPLGYVQASPSYTSWSGRRLAHVNNLHVAEGARGGGLGRRLLATAARWAQGQGMAGLYLGVVGFNPSAAFYERLGMKRAGDRRYWVDEAGLAMLADPAPAG
jgi:GNAT superfamily N-acetyltransferase